MMMMIKGRKDVRPILVKFGLVLAISFAGFLYTRNRNKRIKPPDSPPSNNPDCSRKVDYEGRLKIKDDPQRELDSFDSYDKPCIRIHTNTSSKQASPSNKYTEDKDEFLLPEFDQLIKETNPLNTTTPPPSKTIYGVSFDNYEHEIENLKRTIQFLQQRERKLEIQLLEYYGLKEQQTAILELQNRLKINNIEAKLFSVKIESLESENKRLASQVADYSKVVSELEDAKSKIRVLKRKIRYDAQQNKEQIMEITERVTRLRDYEEKEAWSDKNMNDLEREVDELRKSNEELRIENVDLGSRLELTQFLENSLLEDSEKEELNKELQNLRDEYEKLTKEAERLKEDRCADAEELVYLRWINACLRYELRNYQPPPGKTVARDLSKCLSPTSEKKAKQLILEYANTEDGDHREPSISEFDFENWPSSSYPSYLTDSTEHDDSPRDSSSHKHHHKKLKIFARLRRLIAGKHHHNHRNNLIGRRSQSVEDLGSRRFSSESPRDNSCYDESPKLESPSHDSNNSSDFQSMLRLEEEDSQGRREEALEDDGSKSELARYAEVLRDSRPLLRKHKKSASYRVG